MLDQRFYMSVHLMTALAFDGWEKGKLSPSEQLARSLKTNPTVVRRLIARLADAGLLKAYKGKKGGVELARCPDEVTLEDIYLASSENPGLLRAPKRSPRRQCPVSCSMGPLMKDVFEGVERNSREYLRGWTLADLCQRVKG